MFLADGERPDRTYFTTKPHNCSVFLQREARRRTQVTTANLQPAEGSGLLSSSPDPSPGRRNPEQHWARADSELHPLHHPAMVSITGGVLQPKKPPTKQQQHSPSVQVLLVPSLHWVPGQHESRQGTANRSPGEGKDNPHRSALPLHQLLSPGACTAPRGFGTSSSSSYTTVISNQEDTEHKRAPAIEGNAGNRSAARLQESRHGCCCRVLPHLGVHGQRLPPQH